jgi:DNA-binding beta-propeller fold protein YncE
MPRLLILLTFALAAHAQTTVGALPNELILLTEGVRGDGKHLVQVIRVTCRPDKTGVEIYYYDPKTGVPLTGPDEVVFFPIARENGNCDPKKISVKFKEEVIFDDNFVPLPPPELFSPRAVAAAGATPRWLYVSDNSGRATIVVRHPDTRETVARIETEPRLIGGVVRSPVAERLYATLWRSTTETPPLPAQIAVVNTETNQIVDRIPLTGDMLPSDPAVSKDGKLLYFADETAGLITVDLDRRSILDTIPAARAGAANNRFYTLAVSPDGLLMCLTDSAGVALLDTRTRTFIARINLTLVNRAIPPVFHPNGSLFYLVDRRTVSGATVLSLVAFNTADLTEAARVTLPSTFDPSNAVITTHGASLFLDGFLRPAGQAARGVLITVDTVSNQVVRTNEAVQPTVGALGVIAR